MVPAIQNAPLGAFVSLVPCVEHFLVDFTWNCKNEISGFSRQHCIYQVFEMTDFNKRPKAVSMKPLNFACILKLSKPQLTERSFKVSH